MSLSRRLTRPLSNQLCHLHTGFDPSPLPNGITCEIVPPLSWRNFFPTTESYYQQHKNMLQWRKIPLLPASFTSYHFVLCSSFNGSLWRQLSHLLSPHPPSTPSFSPSSFLSTPIRLSLPPAHENCSCQIHQLHSCTRSKVRTFSVLNLLNYNLQNWSVPLFLNFFFLPGIGLSSHSVTTLSWLLLLVPSHLSDLCDLEWP